MSSVKPPLAQKRSDPPVTIAQLREVGLFGALSDEFLEHLTATLTVQRVMQLRIADLLQARGGHACLPAAADI